MQIFYSDEDPIRAARMLPESRRARMLQEAGQIVAKAFDFTPFLRIEHPVQGDDLADGIRRNTEYEQWVMRYGNYLWGLCALDGNRAPQIRAAWTRLMHSHTHCETRYLAKHNLIPVRLPIDFRRELGYHNGLYEPIEASVIYQQLLNWKYQRSAQ